MELPRSKNADLVRPMDVEHYYMDEDAQPGGEHQKAEH